MQRSQPSRQSFDDVIGEHRAELFERQREVAADALELGDERARVRRHRNADLLRDVDRRLADKRGIRQALRRHELLGKHVRLRRRKEIAALIENWRRASASTA